MAVAWCVVGYVLVLFLFFSLLGETVQLVLCVPSRLRASLGGRLFAGSCRSIVAPGAALLPPSDSPISPRTNGHSRHYLTRRSRRRSCFVGARCAQSRSRVFSAAVLQGSWVRMTILGIVMRFGRCRLRSGRAPREVIGVSCWCCLCWMINVNVDVDVGVGVGVAMMELLVGKK